MQAPGVHHYNPFNQNGPSKANKLNIKITTINPSCTNKTKKKHHVQ